MKNKRAKKKIRVVIKMDKELRELLTKYRDGSLKETRYTYETLSKFFGEELNKIDFTELEFKNYTDCFRELAVIFNDNGVIMGDCRKILSYNKGDDSLNAKWAFQSKGDYKYRNAYNTEEANVKCKDRKYVLKYRKLNWKGL